ncbi:PLDc N-terminal domain-containing protein [Sedimenticola selenatireducens]|uniref:Cardiolipin synthase N-terminal domain-containing protein n=1 Tax=Sedimenticola selenatireducens TaxID=191960 RepID=A0A557SCV4_9GAMM|nr:PLDc N-terminal domain-containing protein [Sedimenticola selenatireducens]TVO75161.1 hypothetical protein FHP88_09105 [Sedimenticola selenatireducens]TVT66984.1 MAG: hypothetical protein FHK78_01250 [Sedimenticola selenatireducens]
MEINGILGLILLLADIFAIIKIVQSSASTGLKIVWIAIVLILPLIGLIIWYLMGPGDKKMQL